MEASTAQEIPGGDQWQFEPKWDGFRCLVFHQNDTVVLQSKAGQSLGRYFPELLRAFKSLDGRAFVLDGEIVVPSDQGLSFDDLLQRIHPAESRITRLAEERPARFVAFDLLYEDRVGLLTDRRLEDRRRALETFFSRVPQTSLLQLSPATLDRAVAEDWFEQYGALGLDGIIAKRLGERYRSGQRAAMVKVKRFKTADCVVGGFRYAAGGGIGSLLLGLYDPEGRLRFVGHAASFTRTEREALRSAVEPLKGTSAFEVREPGGPSRWSRRERSEWEPLRPVLVCEVRYDYFSQNRFRHGTKFLRWRPEKHPASCTLEQVLSHTPRSGLVGPIHSVVSR
jgi:ATP-dependent DNA ligase